MILAWGSSSPHIPNQASCFPTPAASPPTHLWLPSLHLCWGLGLSLAFSPLLSCHSAYHFHGTSAAPLNSCPSPVLPGEHRSCRFKFGNFHLSASPLILCVPPSVKQKHNSANERSTQFSWLQLNLIFDKWLYGREVAVLLLLLLSVHSAVSTVRDLASLTIKAI